MTILNSNFAAVTTTEAWKAAVNEGAASHKGNLVESAIDGKEARN